jgi:ParB family transcriptional regulator, chromosome partitioning protein
MSKKKFDLKGGISNLVKKAEATTEQRFSEAEEGVDNRWDRAAEVTLIRPSGIGAPRTTSPTGATGGEIEVDISLVDDNRYNARVFYDEETVKQRAESIAVNNQIVAAPACVHPSEPGRYMLLGGHYRKRALLRLGRPTITLKLLPVKGLLDLYRLSFAENDERSPGTALDDALSWKKLLDDGLVANHDQIAAVTGKPRTTIAKTLQILTLPPSVLSILQEHPGSFSFTAAYELTLLAQKAPVGEVERAAHRVAANEMTSREIIDLRLRHEAPAPSRKQKEISRQHKIVSDGAVIGTIKDWDSGKVVLEVTLADPADRAKLLDTLKDRFGITADTPQLNLAP